MQRLSITAPSSSTTPPIATRQRARACDPCCTPPAQLIVQTKTTDTHAKRGFLQGGVYYRTEELTASETQEAILNDPPGDGYNSTSELNINASYTRSLINDRGATIGYTAFSYSQEGGDYEVYYQRLCDLSWVTDTQTNVWTLGDVPMPGGFATLATGVYKVLEVETGTDSSDCEESEPVVTQSETCHAALTLALAVADPDYSYSDEFTDGDIAALLAADLEAMDWPEIEHSVEMQLGWTAPVYEALYQVAGEDCGDVETDSTAWTAAKDAAAAVHTDARADLAALITAREAELAAAEADLAGLEAALVDYQADYAAQKTAAETAHAQTANLSGQVKRIEALRDAGELSEAEATAALALLTPQLSTAAGQYAAARAALVIARDGVVETEDAILAAANEVAALEAAVALLELADGSLATAATDAAGGAEQFVIGYTVPEAAQASLGGLESPVVVASYETGSNSYSQTAGRYRIRIDLSGKDVSASPTFTVQWRERFAPQSGGAASYTAKSETATYVEGTNYAETDWQTVDPPETAGTVTLVGVPQRSWLAANWNLEALPPNGSVDIVGVQQQGATASKAGIRAYANAAPAVPVYRAEAYTGGGTLGAEAYSFTGERDADGETTPYSDDLADLIAGAVPGFEAFREQPTAPTTAPLPDGARPMTPTSETATERTYESGPLTLTTTLSDEHTTEDLQAEVDDLITDPEDEEDWPAGSGVTGAAYLGQSLLFAIHRLSPDELTYSRQRFRFRFSCIRPSTAPGAVTETCTYVRHVLNLETGEHTQSEQTVEFSFGASDEWVQQEDWTLVEAGENEAIWFTDLTGEERPEYDYPIDGSGFGAGVILVTPAEEAADPLSGEEEPE